LIEFHIANHAETVTLCTPDLRDSPFFLSADPLAGTAGQNVAVNPNTGTFE
jgi:hypothetical protein